MWFLCEFFEVKFRGMSCEACSILASKFGYRKCVMFWDFYMFYFVEFGNLLM